MTFGGKLHPYMGESGKEAFYSAFSIQIALGMCQLGARGKTAECLDKMLGVPEGHCIARDPALKAFYQGLVAKASGTDQYELTCANALWGQAGAKFNDQYTKDVGMYFGGSFNEVDYVGAPDVAVKIINKWCALATKDKIPEIITADNINPDLRLILTNAIYFKGKWDKPFKKEETHDDDFKSPSAVRKVPFMHSVRGCMYYNDTVLQAIDLKYKGDVSMMVVLPRAETTKDLDQDVDKVFDNIHLHLRSEKSVNISLPKFKMETKYNLGKILSEKLGVSLAFSNDADFSGITETEALKISEVIHKAFVQCDEEGTEAAAATAVSMARCFTPSRPVIFNADHPFLFFIHKGDTVLFSGRVTNPTF